MKRILSILLVVLLVSSCKSQSKPAAFHPIVLKAKETSLYTKQLNWEAINEKFVALTEGKDRVEDLKQGLQYQINRAIDWLND